MYNIIPLLKRVLSAISIKEFKKIFDILTRPMGEMSDLYLMERLFF